MYPPRPLWTTLPCHLGAPPDAEAVTGITPKGQHAAVHRRVEPPPHGAAHLRVRVRASTVQRRGTTEGAPSEEGSVQGVWKSLFRQTVCLKETPESNAWETLKHKGARSGSGAQGWHLNAHCSPVFNGFCLLFRRRTVLVGSSGVSRASLE
eukprot:gene13353-biopygen15576